MLYKSIITTQLLLLLAQQPGTLRAEIEREKETIVEKKEKVIEAATDLLSKSKLGEVIDKKSEKTYEEGAFDSRVKHISEKLTEVAHGVSMSTKNLNSRQESLQSTLNQVSGDWKAKAASKKGTKAQPASGKASAPASSASAKNAPLNRLHQHLNK